MRQLQQICNNLEDEDENDAIIRSYRYNTKHYTAFTLCK